MDRGLQKVNVVGRVSSADRGGDTGLARLSVVVHNLVQILEAVREHPEGLEPVVNRRGVVAESRETLARPVVAVPDLLDPAPLGDAALARTDRLFGLPAVGVCVTRV